MNIQKKLSWWFRSLDSFSCRRNPNHARYHYSTSIIWSFVSMLPKSPNHLVMKNMSQSISWMVVTNLRNLKIKGIPFTGMADKKKGNHKNTKKIIRCRALFLNSNMWYLFARTCESNLSCIESLGFIDWGPQIGGKWKQQKCSLGFHLGFLVQLIFGSFVSGAPKREGGTVQCSNGGCISWPQPDTFTMGVFGNLRAGLKVWKAIFFFANVKVLLINNLVNIDVREKEMKRRPQSYRLSIDLFLLLLFIFPLSDVCFHQIVDWWGRALVWWGLPYDGENRDRRLICWPLCL